MTSPVADTALSMHGVTKQYPQKRALDALDFTVAKGCVKGLLGRNGAGKTTLIESALGLRPVDGGQIRLLGEAPGAFSDDVRSGIGYVAQDADLFEWMTGQQMLDFFSAFYPRWNAGKVASLIDRWSIPSTVRIGQLSGGEKQRLAIIRALAHEPEFLLLDEPVASLDPAGRRDFLKEVVELTVDRGTTVLFSTHIVSDLERIASDVAIMADGRIVLDQPIDDLTERTFRLTGTAAALSAEGGRVLSRGKAGEWEQCIVLFPDGSLAALEGLRANGIRVEPVGLEDILIEATR